MSIRGSQRGSQRCSLRAKQIASETVVSSNGLITTAIVGSLLNMNAGFINACVWTEFGRSTTHVTGMTTLSAMALVQQRYSEFGRLMLQLTLFIFGAFVSSLCVGGQKKFHIGPTYSAALSIVGLLVFVSSFPEIKHAVIFIIPFSAGLQNALATFFSGAVVRTTHVTGTATDIGIELANYLSGRNPQVWKLQLLTYFLFAFFSGSFFGCGAAALWGQRALLFPSGLSISLSVGSLWYYYSVMERENVTSTHKIAKVEPMNATPTSDLEVGSSTRSRGHRASIVFEMPSTISVVHDFDEDEDEKNKQPTTEIAGESESRLPVDAKLWAPQQTKKARKPKRTALKPVNVN